MSSTYQGRRPRKLSFVEAWALKKATTLAKWGHYAPISGTFTPQAGETGKLISLVDSVFTNCKPLIDSRGLIIQEPYKNSTTSDCRDWETFGCKWRENSDFCEMPNWDPTDDEEPKLEIGGAFYVTPAPIPHLHRKSPSPFGAAVLLTDMSGPTQVQFLYQSPVAFSLWYSDEGETAEEAAAAAVEIAAIPAASAPTLIEESVAAGHLWIGFSVNQGGGEAGTSIQFAAMGIYDGATVPPLAAVYSEEAGTIGKMQIVKVLDSHFFQRTGKSGYSIRGIVNIARVPVNNTTDKFLIDVLTLTDGGGTYTMIGSSSCVVNNTGESKSLTVTADLQPSIGQVEFCKKSSKDGKRLFASFLNDGNFSSNVGDGPTVDLNAYSVLAFRFGSGNVNGSITVGLYAIKYIEVH